MITYRRRASLSTIAAIALVVACGASTDHPPPAGTSSSSGGVGGSSSGGPGGLDGGRPADSAAGDSAITCEPASQKGAPIAEVLLDGAPPTPLGGTLLPGTYVLTELDFYATTPDGGGNGTTDLRARATIVVAGNLMSMIASRGPKTSALPADTATGATFTIAGTSLLATAVCPSAGPQKTIPFSAVGGGLALIIDAKHRELYTKE